MQAESFYRYRWTLHSLHDPRAYPLQTAAAVLDFGPFSVFAAGNGVVRIGIAAVFAALFAVPLIEAIHQDALGCKRIAVSIVGFIGLQVSCTTAYQDAQRAALEYDERQEAAVFASHPSAP